MKVRELSDAKGIVIVAHYDNRKEKALARALKETRENRCSVPGCRAARQPGNDKCREHLRHSYRGEV